MTLRAAAKSLTERASAVGLKGRCFAADDVKEIRSRIPAYPQWLADLLREFPLCGLELGWQAYPATPEFDGVDWVEVSLAECVISETLELYPGLAIHPAGYINFGGGCGSGDPFFISVHDGPDPPLYRVFHDVSDKADVILSQGREMVAPHLSHFLESAHF